MSFKFRKYFPTAIFSIKRNLLTIKKDLKVVIDLRKWRPTLRIFFIVLLFPKCGLPFVAFKIARNIFIYSINPNCRILDKIIHISVLKYKKADHIFEMAGLWLFFLFLFNEEYL